jgi:hypothetical protein
MESTCSYCNCRHLNGLLKCQNCGAPVDSQESEPSDIRLCPYCLRRLLTLGSPACNYCGRPLPAEYVHAREAILKAITVKESAVEDGKPPQLASDLVKAGRPIGRGNRFSLGDLFDLTDLFS